MNKIRLHVWIPISFVLGFAAYLSWKCTRLSPGYYIRTNGWLYYTCISNNNEHIATRYDLYSARLAAWDHENEERRMDRMYNTNWITVK